MNIGKEAQMVGKGRIDSEGDKREARRLQRSLTQADQRTIDALASKRVAPSSY